MTDYPNSGTLFDRDKKTEKSPDVGGKFTIDDAVLDYVVECVNAGKPVELEMSGWHRVGASGTSFTSISIQTPYNTRQQADVVPRRRVDPRAQPQQSTRFASRDAPIQTTRGPLVRTPVRQQVVDEDDEFR